MTIVSRFGRYLGVFALLAGSLGAVVATGRPSSAQTSSVSAADEAEYDAAFQEMLRKPSDLDTLFKFAMIASRTGDLEGAISALERMLRNSAPAGQGAVRSRAAGAAALVD